MTATLNGVTFDGPRGVDAWLPALPGIYVIARTDNVVVDVGETENLAERIGSHDRRSCWDRNQGAYVWFWHQPSRVMRLMIESSIRKSVNPTCGIR